MFSFSQCFMVLKGFPGQILIPSEISCPGMVSDPGNIEISLRMTISLTTNHLEKKIIIFQACQGLRSQPSQQMNTRLIKSDAEYIMHSWLNSNSNLNVQNLSTKPNSIENSSFLEFHHQNVFLIES